jgi:hypothetical protein
LPPSRTRTASPSPRINRYLTAFAAAAFLAGCGGGSDEATTSTASTPAAAAAQLRTAMSAQAQTQVKVSAAVSPAQAAEQLLNFAETTFPNFFPVHQTTGTFDPFLFRYYPQTGVYVGVVVKANMGYTLDGVYVMGGPFGDAPIYVGQLNAFITPGAVMLGRSWLAPQSLEENSSAAPVLDHRSTIDDAGRVTVIFRKSNGSRDALYATRGNPNGPGLAPTWSTPVPIDLQGATPVSNMGSVQMSVTAAPGGDAVALWNHYAPCTATTYDTAPFQCRYYYYARYRVATDQWDAPALLTDTPDGAFTTFVNDRGDTVFLGNSWVRFRTLRPAVKAIFMKTAAETSFRRQLLSDEPTTAFQALQMDMDAAGNLLLATQFAQDGVSQIMAFRGTAAAGLGNPVQLNTLASRAVLLHTSVGLNGTQVVVWYHPDVGFKTFAATRVGADTSFTVTDLVHGSSSSVLQVTDTGSAILCSPGCRQRQNWTPEGGWTAPTDTGSLIYNIYDGRRDTAVSRNGDLLWVDGVGTTATYDSALNASIIANSDPFSRSYVLGLANGSATYAKPLLSVSGIGFVAMKNTYAVMPTPSAPAGVVRAGVNSLWGAFLK